MTAAADRQHVRFLGGIIATGFFGVALTLALIFEGGVAPLLAAFFPLIGVVLVTRGELKELPPTAAGPAATDGGRELDSEAVTGGDRNRRQTN
jgi:hypothetical protein